MKTSFELVAEFRETQGKGASRRLRHEGKVPAILYGGHADARTLMRELRAIGATNADTKRTRSLTGKAHLQRVIAAYETFRHDGVLPATYEVVYAHALAPDPGQPRRTAGGDIASFSVDQLRGSRRR